MGKSRLRIFKNYKIWDTVPCLLKRNGDFSMRRRRAERRGQLSFVAERSFAIAVEGTLLLSGRVLRLACGRMARQATLFGKAAVKKVNHSSSSILNAAKTTKQSMLCAWQLHPGNDHQEFFRAAPDQWSAKYKGNDEAVAALLERVEGRSSTDGRCLMPSFIGATGRCSKEPVADAGSAPVSSSLSSTTGTVSTESSLFPSTFFFEPHFSTSLQFCALRAVHVPQGICACVCCYPLAQFSESFQFCVLLCVLMVYTVFSCGYLCAFFYWC